MVRIRLRRVGAKKQPSYRIVVADKRSPRDGRFIENIGFYNPRTEPATIHYEEERALYWLSVGAQPSEAVNRMFANLGTLQRLERLREGEEMMTLVDEALAEAEAREPVNPKTQRPATGTSKKKAKAAIETAASAEAEVAAEAEASTESEEEVAAEAEAATEGEEEAAAEAEAATEDEADAATEEEAESEAGDAAATEEPEEAEETAKDDEE